MTPKEAFAAVSVLGAATLLILNFKGYISILSLDGLKMMGGLFLVALSAQVTTWFVRNS